MNWKTLVPVTLPVNVPHSAAGNKNKMKSAKNPIACNSTDHHQDPEVHFFAAVELSSGHKEMDKCSECIFSKLLAFWVQEASMQHSYQSIQLLARGAVAWFVSAILQSSWMLADATCVNVHTLAHAYALHP